MPIRVSLAALVLIAAVFAADAWSSRDGSDLGGLQSTGEAGIRDVSSPCDRGQGSVDCRATSR